MEIKSKLPWADKAPWLGSLQIGHGVRWVCAVDFKSQGASQAFVENNNANLRAI